MRRGPAHPIVTAVVVALLLTACAPGGATPERQRLDDRLAEYQAANAAAAADDHDHGDHDHGDEPDGSEEVSTEPEANDAVEPTNEPTTVPSSESTGERSLESPERTTSDGPEGPVMEQHDDFPITATLSATCVQRGGPMTLTVEAGQDTAVVYLTYYAGGENGAPPPYGDGHGGNSGDMTDSSGQYEDTWVVSPDAPVGSARVEVQAARMGDKRSTAVLRFEVVDVGGRCGQ